MAKPSTPASDLESLVHLPDPALRIRWKVAFNQAPPPGSRRDFLLGGLAYHLQQQTANGLSSQAQKTLRDVARSLAQGAPPSKAPLGPLKAGTRLLRTWQGESHEVLVLEKGFSYRGATYTSLSEIARAITGARWSGPLFFGLKPPSRPKRSAPAKGGC